ncbi:Phosphorylase b kinase regulatory subunit alpha [Cichlidogyrus casuarinus]|uniref:Phosphorylase b kinase regulatory subunit n=1 Tax=Cichlidogyrus casuarinus TaxID=1844966 RepID=A0ABD2PYT5_9PLAT
MSKATSELAREENAADEDTRSDYEFQRPANVSVEGSIMSAPKLRLYKVEEDHPSHSPRVRKIHVGVQGIANHHLLKGDQGDARTRKAALKRIVTPYNLQVKMDHSLRRISGQETVSELQELSPEAIIERLAHTDNLAEQAEILGTLKQLKGLDWDTKMDAKSSSTTTVRDLLKEVYERASVSTSWFILRYTAGLLGKRIDTLAKALTDILILQKQVTVGLPPEPREKVITAPLAPCQIAELIQQASGEDSLMAMLTQEILVYLAMIARTQPQLLRQMLRLRIGLIIQMMGSELARSMECSSTEDALFRLFSMSPFDTKRLLLNLLSGNEVRRPRHHHSWTSSQGKTVMKKSTGVRHAALIAAAASFDENSAAFQETSDIIKEEEDLERTREQWCRRRKIDGALNRCPPGFYERIYLLLERVNGLKLGDSVIHQSLTKEMTRGEIKFALKVENCINCITTPEYRQLCVEAMMVLGTMISHDTDRVIELHCIICVDDLVAHAHRLFLEDHQKNKANAILCCASQINSDENQTPKELHCCGPHNICKHFFDTPPAGRYGTMSYLVRALTFFIKDSVPSKNGKLAINCAVQ